MEPIQAKTLRGFVGGSVPTWNCLLPWVVSKSEKVEYHLPTGFGYSRFHGKSLRSLKRERKLKNWSDRQKTILKVLLERDIGLSPLAVKILLDRPKVHFHRIVDFINGVQDSCILADLQAYGEEKIYKMHKYVIRKIFLVGTYNLQELTRMWKEYTNTLFHKYAQSILMDGMSVSLSSGNIFREFRLLEEYWGFSIPFKRDHVKLLQHMTSTRQLPYMGKKTEEKAWVEFERIITEPFTPKPETLQSLRLGARRIGRICRLLAKRPAPDSILHFSVTGSGDLHYPISKGGNAGDTWDHFLKEMNQVAEETKVEDTPFGPFRTEKGLHIWKTAFRPKATGFFNQVPTGDLGAERRNAPMAPKHITGLDDYTGEQIRYVAWKYRSNTPEIRAEVVPEMGDKARIVTCCDFSHGPLQAPISHLLKWYLGYHPSAHSSLLRCDQAWESLKILCEVKHDPEKHFVLSSDLSNATNAIPFQTALAVLEGFMLGAGIDPGDPTCKPFWDLIGPRVVFMRSIDRYVYATRGIFMGEAIAKPILTILNLVVEELAFLDYVSVTPEELGDDPAPHRVWRGLHIAGDDLLAHGPAKYLNSITDWQLRSGCEISLPKHGMSKNLVRYTEHILYIPNLLNRIRYKEVNSNLDRSIWTDSVKVRLLERGQSTQLKKDDRNVAFGKAMQL